MTAKGKIYFVSDLHLGVPSREESLVREKHFVKWLDKVSGDASEIYLMGDVFDFWFEYRRAVPKGFTRMLGKLAELSDAGVVLHYFAGNHDLWLKDYFKEELGAQIYFKPEIRMMHGNTFFIHHGDGLGPGDHKYKFAKWVFTRKFFQWCYSWVHPDFGIRIASFFSGRSRKKNLKSEGVDYGEKEFQWIFAKETLKENPQIDYFVFGHRHIAKFQELEPGKTFVNLGDWIDNFTYLEVSKDGVELREFGKPFPANRDGRHSGPVVAEPADEHIRADAG